MSDAYGYGYKSQECDKDTVEFVKNLVLTFEKGINISI